MASLRIFSRDLDFQVALKPSKSLAEVNTCIMDVFMTRGLNTSPV